MQVGDQLKEVKMPPVTRTDIVKYQGASGDFDAAHHDDEHAKSFGYPTIFSLGMLHAGQLSAYVVNSFPNGKLHKYTTKFKGIVFPGETLTFSGEVTDVEKTDNSNRVTVEIAAKNDDERAVVLGAAIVDV